MSRSIKKVCIISDVFKGGGIETRVGGQVKFLNSKGVSVDLICGMYENKNNIKFNNVVNNRQLSGIDGQSAYQEILFLRDYFINNRIDVVDCHNHYSILASLAASMAGVPAVLTLHGKYCVNYNINDGAGYLLKRYTTKYGFGKVFAVAEYVAALYSSIDTTILRNGVNTSKYRISKLPKNGDFALVTRLDELKSQPVMSLLSILKNTNIRQLHIYGEGPSKEFVESYVEQNGLGDRVVFEGWSSDISGELLDKYDGVFGMGRVVVEALAMNIPVVVLGYGGVAFAVNKGNIQKASEMNFTAWESHDSEYIIEAIQNVIDSPKDFMCRNLVKARLDESKIWSKYYEEIKKISFSNLRATDIGLILNSLTDKTRYEANSELLLALRSNFMKEMSHEISYISHNDSRSLIESTKDTVIQSENMVIERINSYRPGSLARAAKTRAKQQIAKLRGWPYRPKIVAITSYRFDKDYLDDWRINLRGLVDDYIVVYDADGSLMRDEGSFRKGLIDKAVSMGADWVVALDPDERIEVNAVDKLKKLAKKYNGQSVIFRFNFRELYSPDKYRIDGIWNKKERFLMFPLLRDNIYSSAKLHAPKHPLNENYQKIDTDLNIYHLKHIDPKLRRHRANLYKHIDPVNKWQKIGYDYLNDEDNIRLEAIPRDRRYMPKYRDYLVDDAMFDFKNY